MAMPRLPSALLVATLLALFHLGPAAAAIRTEWVDYKQGDQPLQGLLAYDDGLTGRRPGVLLIHRRDGMSDFTMRDAVMVAKLGYVVFAPDIYGKEFRPKDVKEMIVLSGKFQNDRPLMRARTQAGFDILRQHPMVDAAKLAMVGYCFGGNVAAEFAEQGAPIVGQGAPIVGTIIVHGSFRNLAPGAAKNIKGRVLILHSADDDQAPLADVMRFAKDMTDNKIGWEMRLYAGTDHAYTSEATGADGERAAIESNAATQQFFKEVFGL
jgi:dienelactone hydrolase